MAHYQPRHTSREVADATPRRRRSVVVLAAVAGAVVVAAAITVPLMMSGGGGGGNGQAGKGPAKTDQAAARATTSASTATDAAGAGTTGAAGETSHVPAGGAGSAGVATTPSTEAVSTTTTRPHISPAATTSPAVNSSAPNGFGQLITTLWVDAHPGGVRMSVADVASVLPGSVFFSEQPAIETYWAIARFVPSSEAQSRAGTSAGQALLAQFDSTAIFVKVGGSPWAYLKEYTTTPCGQGVPGPVLSSWGMCGP